MNIWTKVFVSDVRGFDAPGRWLMQPSAGRAEFTSALWRTVAELAAWAADVASDPDDPAARARMTEFLTATEQVLGILRLGAAEAITREVQGESRSPRPARPSIRAALEQGETLSLDHLRAAGVRIDVLTARTGTVPRNLEEYLGGKRPAGWVQRKIAEALHVERHEIWPPRDGGPLHRGSLDDDRARRASERNLGAGRSRGVRTEEWTHG